LRDLGFGNFVFNMQQLQGDYQQIDFADAVHFRELRPAHIVYTVTGKLMMHRTQGDRRIVARSTPSMLDADVMDNGRRIRISKAMRTHDAAKLRD